MDADERGADGFEFNLTRVLESLDRQQTSLADLSALAAPPTRDPEPLTVAPVSDDPAPLAPLPTRVPSQRGRGQQQQTRSAPRPSRSAPSPTPAEPLPIRTAPAPAAEPAPLARRAVFDDAARGEARAALHRVPADTNVAVAALDVPVLPAPTLPAPGPTPPPPAGAAGEQAATIPTAADVRQFQSAQRRQARKSREGRVMGRVVLVLILFTTAIALALTIGRDYLFTAGWSDELAPLVAEVEAARGAPFESALTLVDQPASEYTATVTRVVLGPDPAARIAVWRALGVASGPLDAATLGAQLAAIHPVVHDSDASAIVRLEGTNADLRTVLATALDEQLAGTAAAGPIDVLGPVPPAAGPVVDPASLAVAPSGPLSPPIGAIAAAEQIVADPSLSAPPTLATIEATPPVVDPSAVAAVLPLAYQVAAGERLAAQLAGTPVGLAAEPVVVAPEAALAPGDTPLAGPVGIGLDDWSLVWRNRLPSDSVATLVAATSANSVRTFERGGVACVGAVFEAGNELFAAALLADLGRWAAAGPAEAQAMVAQVAPTYVQLVTCDPGAVPQRLDPAAVDAVIERQTVRLTALPAETAATVPAGTSVPTTGG